MKAQSWLTLATLLALVPGCATSSPRATAPVAGLDLPLARDRAIESRSESDNDGIRIENLTARDKSGRVLRLQKLSGTTNDAAEQFIKDKLFQIETIYEPHRDPYFAVLTKGTTCPAAFMPARREDRLAGGELLRTVELYANDRLTYGACTPKLAAYRLVLGLTYCPASRSIFIVENFVPVALFGPADAEAVRAARCL